MDLAVSAFAVAAFHLRGGGIRLFIVRWTDFMSQKTHPIRVKRGLAAATPSRYMKRVKRGWERGWGYTIFTLIAEGFKGAASAPTPGRLVLYLQFATEFYFYFLAKRYPN